MDRSVVNRGFTISTVIFRCPYALTLENQMAEAGLRFNKLHRHLVARQFQICASITSCG
jgi:hypothetical protein